MNKFRKGIIVLVAMALLAMGGTAVFAQRSDGNNAAPPMQGDFQQGHPQQGQNGRFVDPAAVTAATADILGISVEELESAHDEAVTLVRTEAIAQAVADGRITQEEADQILERMELRSIAHDLFSRDMMVAVVADTLGMSVEELEAAHEDGVRLPELAAEAGIEMSDLGAAIEQAKTDTLQAAVDSGLITQEQADAIASHNRPPHGHHPNGQGRPNGQHGNFPPNGAPQGDFNAAPNNFNG